MENDTGRMSGSLCSIGQDEINRPAQTEERIPGALRSPRLRPAGANHPRRKVFNLSNSTILVQAA